MAKYKSDLQDIEFNLFKFLEVQKYKDFGLEIADMKGILSEFDKFVENEVFPSREPSDLDGVKHVDGNVIAPDSIREFHKNYYANGWFGLGLPEDIGGAPAPEALTIACGSLLTGANTAYSMYPGLSKGALNVIRLKGSEAIKSKYIEKIVDGTWSGTMCLTEAGAGSDVGALRTTATPNDDGSYNIKGIKIFISGGEIDIYENTIHLVLARTPGAPEGTKGISLFLVPRFRVNDDKTLGESNNVTCTKIEHKMGIHASATCELTFGSEGDCKGWLVGEELDGMATMFIMMNEARLLCGVQGESQGNLAYLLTDSYAKERSQFGKEISKHPDVKRMLVKMRSAGRGMRALCFYTADLFDQAKTDHSIEGRIGLLTPICKAYCSEEGFQISTEAVQVHGGYGYCQEYGVEQFVRDTVIAKIYEGTNGIQATDFVMRKIIKNEGKDITALLKEIQAFAMKLPSEFKSEQALLGESLKNFEVILQGLMKDVASKSFNKILGNCHDIMMMASHLTVSWLLGEHALKALDHEDKKFSQSKQDDFSFYCRYYLTKNIGLARSISYESANLENLVL